MATNVSEQGVSKGFHRSFGALGLSKTMSVSLKKKQMTLKTSENNNNLTMALSEYNTMIRFIEKGWITILWAWNQEEMNHAWLSLCWSQTWLVQKSMVGPQDKASKMTSLYNWCSWHMTLMTLKPLRLELQWFHGSQKKAKVGQCIIFFCADHCAEFNSPPQRSLPTLARNHKASKWIRSSHESYLDSYTSIQIHINQPIKSYE